MALNGQIGPGILVGIGSGQALRADAAASWLRVVADTSRRFGIALALTDSYRPLATQVRIFLERYSRTYVQFAPGRIDRRVWDGIAYYRKPGTAAAAVPGTSNHGLGLAVDVRDMGGFASTKYKALEAAGCPAGWNNKAGLKIDEPWHWEYVPEADAHPTPAPTTEDDMTPEQDNLLRHVVAMLGEVPARTAAAVAAVPVNRVEGKPSTWLQDDVNGTTNTFELGAKVDALAAAVAAIKPGAVSVDYAALAAALVAHIKP